MDQESAMLNPEKYYIKRIDNMFGHACGYSVYFIGKTQDVLVATFDNIEQAESYMHNAYHG